MKILGCFLIFCAILDIITEGITFSMRSILAILLCVVGIKCFLGFKGKHRVRIQKNSKKNSFSSDSGYEGHVQGEIINLGNGQYFDSHNPDDIVDGVNWKSDGYGGYYNSGTGESIENNNGRYSYYDSSDNS